ncbi:MAG TPA: histidine kinase [Natronosporangium sp.]
MTVGSLLRPLVSGATYRRGVHLLLGGVLILPYVLLGTAFVQLWQSDQPLGVVLLLLAVTAVIATVPAFLRATRTLETVAARALLGVDLPDPVADPPPLEARLRSALWFATHLVTGGAVGLTLLIVLPMALVFLSGYRGDPLPDIGPVWLTLAGIAMLVGLVYAVAGLGALAAVMAPVLLGPSPAERIAALEAEAGQLAERNRLARELHDSVGHALTVTTLQAAAAREVLDRDPAFVRRALAAIEETGRAAMAELDQVIGLLRAGEGAASKTPARTLGDLDRLIAEARGTGTQVTVDISGTVDRVPAVVSREGYRIVQESLTNAARHATGEPVALRVAVGDGGLTIEVTNRLRGTAGSTGYGGRGLAGMRERVSLLGGKLRAEPVDGAWQVSAWLPTGGRERQ